MDRETLNYISRKVREGRQSEDAIDKRMESVYPNEYPHDDEHRISSRYNSTNTYRAEGVVEGRIEHHSHDPHKERKIGFGSSEDTDYVYKMEETFEKEVNDILYYSELAMEAERKGHAEFAEGFYEIAKEKLECAERVRMRLIKCCGYKPSSQTELEDMFDRAKHLFRRL